MHMLADGGSRRHRLENPVAEVVRVRTRESQAAESVDRTDRTQEIGEVVRTIVVGVDRLPQENDFAQPIGDGDWISRTTSGRARLRSGPRVVGTMQ